MIIVYPFASARNWFWGHLIIMCEVEIVEQSNGDGFGGIKVSEAVSSSLRAWTRDFDCIRYSLLLDE